MTESYYGTCRELAVHRMVREISGTLSDCEPSIYLYGSSVLDDFRLGWSDIDILVLTGKQITEEQAKTLVGLREALLADEPDNPYYRSFEGGMLTLDAFLSKGTRPSGLLGNERRADYRSVCV